MSGILGSFLFVICCGASFAQRWVFETVDNSVNVGWYSDIALDSLDYPHISYFDAYNDALKYACWNGNDWEIQTVDTGVSPDELDGSTSIALDSQGYPRIAYSTEHGNPGDTMRYACWDGSTWQKTDVVSSGYAHIYCSLVLDSSDYPHISWCHETGNALKYACWTGSEWQITSVDQGSCTGYCTSIDLDSSDYPHISYIDAWNGLLKYARWNGGSWDIDTVDSPGYTGFEGIGTSIAVDSLDFPHIAYTYWITDDLRYAHNNGTGWLISTIDSQGITGKEPSIALDSEGFPHIAFRRCLPSGLKYACWTGTEWELTTLNENSYYDGHKCSIALGSWDNPHISYGINSTCTLEYAWYDTGVGTESFSTPVQTAPMLLLDPYPSPAEYSVTVDYSLSSGCDVELAVFTVNGKRVATLVDARQPTGLYSAVWDCTGMPCGVYIVRMNAGEHTETRRLVIRR